MRWTLLLLITTTFLVAGCGTVGTVPPQQGGEPRTIMLSEMAGNLGWTYETGPNVYDYTMKSPQGDLVTFTMNKDIVKVNGQRWRYERDAVEVDGRDLLLPESVYHWVADHFGQHHLLRSRLNDERVEYDLEPIDAGVAKAKPAPKTDNTKVVGDRLKGVRIVIDAGHGGRDPGGIGHGVHEKDVVLPVALELQKLCKAQGAIVMMTRTKDTYPTLDERVSLANRNKADLFISIHANIAPNNESAEGFETFYNAVSDSGRRFSQAIVSEMEKVTDSPNRGAKKDPRGLRVLEKTKMTATLIELGFLSNAEEANRLTQSTYQKSMAKAIFEGICNHVKNKAVISR